MIERFKKIDPIKLILASTVFLFSLVIYMMTMAPTVSFWDCGEFIATSHILGVPHPPGSPFYLLLGRFFSILPLGHDVAWRVTLISPIVTALANMFLFLAIIHFVRMYRGAIRSTSDKIIAYGGGFIGSLTFAFTDSHWFNAVEAEVYSMSTFFTAIIVWLILVWEEFSEKPGHERYLLLIFYIIGIATGVHLLNLLALPFIAMIIYFKKFEYKPKTFAIMVGIVAVVFVVIYKGIIKGFPRYLDMFGLGVVGFILFAIILIAVIFARSEYRMLRLITMALALTIIGFSTYATVFIRAKQDPAIDENDPETTEAFISYMEREQYGSTSILPRDFKGKQSIERVLGLDINYTRSGDIYIDKNHDGVFGSGDRKMKVDKWGRPKYPWMKQVQYMLHDPEKQFSYFWNYQFVKMYLRYFLWQFAGRSPTEAADGIDNDGDDEIDEYDESLIHDFDNMHANIVKGKIKANPVEDGVDFSGLWSLPLLFGLFGMYFYTIKDKQSAFSVFILFIMTGFMILIYLNQPDPQPRERDYSYVGSFYAFSIFIGLGVSGLLEMLKEKFNNKTYSIFCIVILLIMPGIVLSKNYFSHNRQGDFMPWDYSYNLLQSCEPGGILFTNGDNDTFPLWYLQEVENVRKDVRVVNLSLLNTGWYIKQLKNRDPKVPVKYSEKIIESLEPFAITYQGKKIERLLNGANPKINKTGKRPILSLSIDAPENVNKKIEFNVRPTVSGVGLRVQDLMVIHILAWNNWEKPIYFAVTVPTNNRIGLDKYLTMEGVVFRVSQKSSRSGISSKAIASHFLDPLTGEAFSRDYDPRYRFRALNDSTIHFNETTIRLVGNYRQAFMQLTADYATRAKRKPERAKELRNKARNTLDKMEELMPQQLLPMSPDFLANLTILEADIGDEESVKALKNNITDPKISMKRRLAYAEMMLDFDPILAVELIEEFLKEDPDNVEIISLLVAAYDLTENHEKAIVLLSEWLELNPEDLTAKQYKTKLEGKFNTP